MDDLKAELTDALRNEDETDRKLAIVAVIDELVRDLNLRPVVVGGTVVQYWTRGDYSTPDIDLLLPFQPEIERRLRGLGFERKGRYWVLPRQGVLIEAPGSFLHPYEHAEEVHLPNGRSVLLLRPEDVLISRVHEFVAGGYRESASQAISLLLVADLDRDYLKARAEQENLREALDVLVALAGRVERGESFDSAELHDIARSLRERR